MFGTQKLKDEIEALQEERNYFRSKFLEQVSEIVSLKEALQRSEKEVLRLRRAVMAAGGKPPLSPPRRSPTRSSSRLEEEKKGDKEDPHPTMEQTISSLTLDDDEDDEEGEEGDDDYASSEEEDEDENLAIRQKAEQLVQWASYRQEAMLPDRSSDQATEDQDDTVER